MIFTASQPKYSVLDLGFDKSLTKALSGLQGSADVPPELVNAFTQGTAAKSLLAGELISSLEQQAGVVFSGKTAFDNTQLGYRLGLDTDGLAKFYIGNTTDYINWDGSTLTIVGGVSIDSIDIGGSDATSFHVDTSGNMWLGAATFAAGTARISNAGAAVFTNVQIGSSALQYTVTDNGMQTYGSGADGAATFADQGTAPTGTTKTDNTAGATIFRLDRDVFYTTVTLNATVTINPNGYRFYASTSATINGTISLNGPAGGNGSSGDSGGGGGTAGAALADGYLKGSAAGNGGGAGGASSGDDGVAGSGGATTANSIGSVGAAGGAGGGGLMPDNPGGSAGGAGTFTASNVALSANWHLTVLLDVATSGSTAKFNNSSGSGGGGGGGAGTNANVSGGGGGAGGIAGGIIAVYAKSLTIGAAGVIRANGGNGGNGGDGDTGGGGANGAGGGGGGGGGNGGQIILVYNTISNSGTTSVTAGTGGTGGAAGIGTPNGTAGSNGSNGTAGTVRTFQLSL